MSKTRSPQALGYDVGYKRSENPASKHRKHTPIVSEAQRGAMGVAYAAKKGKIPVSELKGPAKEMHASMPKKELRSHLKEAGGKDLPKKVRRG